MPAPISEDIRGLFTSIALENHDWPPPKVHEEGERILLEQGHKLYDIPSLAWTYKLVRQVRRAHEPEGWPDQPWSVGSLADRRFAMVGEALADLLAVSRLALIGNRPFKNRQAQWVARLRLEVPKALSPFQRTSELYSWSALYAREETITEVLAAETDSRDSNTSSLDGEFGFYDFGWFYRKEGGWVGLEAQKLARKIGLLPPSGGRSFSSRSPGFKYEHRELQDPMIWNPLDDSVWELEDLLEIRETRGGPRRIDQLQVAEYEAVLLALRHHGETDPKWPGLPREDKQRFADDLVRAVRRDDEKAFQELSPSRMKRGSDGDA